MSTKQIVQDLLEKLPANVSLHDVPQEIEFVAAVRLGLAEIDRGERIPIEEIERELPSWVIRYQSLRKSVPGFASPTPEGLSVNSRGCARHEHTPGKGSRNACHPGGVVPSPERLDDLVPGEPLRGSGALRRESGGVARASLPPRLFTVNPSGVRPWVAPEKWISLRPRRPWLAMVLLGWEATCTVQTP